MVSFSGHPARSLHHKKLVMQVIFDITRLAGPILIYGSVLGDQAKRVLNLSREWAVLDWSDVMFNRDGNAIT